VNGRANADAAHTTQVGQSGTAYTCLKQDDVNLTSPPLTASCTDSTTGSTFTSAFTNAPFQIDTYIPSTANTCPAPGDFSHPNGFVIGAALPGGCTRDIVHRYYQEQYQLDGGKQDQGFEHTSVHVTSDGGRSWRPVSYPALPEGFYGASAWVGPWRTTDWGRSWRMSPRPDQVFPRTLRLAFHGRLDVDTALGTLGSRDDGHTWHTRPPLSALSVARVTGALAFVQPALNEYHVPVAYLRTPRGWRPLATRFFFPGAVAFLDARHGLLTMTRIARRFTALPTAVVPGRESTFRRACLRTFLSSSHRELS
jgi:hypothetical protein